MTQHVRSTPSGPADRVRISYEEFLRRHREDNHVEWVDGEVVAMSPITNEHNAVGNFLLHLLDLYVQAHGLGVVHSEPFQMKTGPKLPGRSPDVLFVATKNLHRVKRTHLAGPADLVVEVISPGSRGVDRGEKFYEYEKGGVKEYWLIDPERRQAEFYRLGRDGIYNLVGVEDGCFRSSVLKGFELEVEWLWQRPLPLVKVLKQWKLV